MALFNYECDEVKRKIIEVKPNYPQLTTYESEWLYFHEHHYNPGTPVELEYETVSVNPSASVFNAIPFNYKSAILKGNTDENLQSVKMPVLRTTGKNLFDINKAIKIDEEKFNETNYVSNNNGVLTVVASKSIEFVISKEKFEVNTQYTLSFKVLGTAAFHSGWIKIYHTDGSEKNLANSATPNVESFIKITSDANKTVDRISIFGNGIATPKFYDIQVEKGVQSSSYEPYNSNILTVNEDVELRGIGEVKDELDLLTGEISNNFNKITIDGTEKWYKTSNETELSVRYRCDNIGVSILKDKICICDNYSVGDNTTGDKLTVAFAGTTATYRVLKSKFPTLEDFKKWLNNNPHTFIYQTEKTIKTVDLTPLNKPYEGTNHYELTSNIPCEAILEVPVVSTGKQTLEEINN